MRFIFSMLTVLALSLVLPSCSSESGAATTRTYEMGAKAQVGNLGYTVFERQWLNQIGEPGTPDVRVPQNRFLLVRMSVLNAGGSTASMPNVRLVDDHGKTYEEVSNGDNVPQWIGALRQINSADTLQGNVLFDVPPQHYKVLVADEEGKDSAYIDIPLSFDATSSDVPEAPKKN